MIDDLFAGNVAVSNGGIVLRTLLEAALIFEDAIDFFFERAKPLGNIEPDTGGLFHHELAFLDQQVKAR